MADAPGRVLTPGESWVATGWLGGPQNCREWNPPCVATGEHEVHVPPQCPHPEWVRVGEPDGEGDLLRCTRCGKTEGAWER